jgi:hypothetical protein
LIRAINPKVESNRSRRAGQHNRFAADAIGNQAID